MAITVSDLSSDLLNSSFNAEGKLGALYFRIIHTPGSQISDACRLVLCGISYFGFNFSNNEQPVFVSKSKIASVIGISERSVYAALAKLEAVGLIRRLAQPKSQGESFKTSKIIFTSLFKDLFLSSSSVCKFGTKTADLTGTSLTVDKQSKPAEATQKKVVPHDLRWLSAIGVADSVIFKSMKIAKQLHKVTLSSLLTSSWRLYLENSVSKPNPFLLKIVSRPRFNTEPTPIKAWDTHKKAMSLVNSLKPDHLYISPSGSVLRLQSKMLWLMESELDSANRPKLSRSSACWEPLAYFKQLLDNNSNNNHSHYHLEEADLDRIASLLLKQKNSWENSPINTEEKKSYKSQPPKGCLDHLKSLLKRTSTC